MKKAKFVQDAKLYPSRYYRNPSDIVRDRRLTVRDRLEILAAWERNGRAHQENDQFAPGDDEALRQLRRLREELERSADAVAGATRGTPVRGVETTEKSNGSR